MSGRRVGAQLGLGDRLRAANHHESKLVQRLFDFVLPREQPALEARLPALPPGIVADVRPYSAMPVPEYRGPLALTKVAPGLVAGRVLDIQKRPELEIHLRLPRVTDKLALDKDAQLRLELRDGVEASSLHRRIALHDAERRVLLAFVSEGSDGTYRTVLEPSGLAIEQLPADPPSESPRVRVSLDGLSATLSKGERGTLGDGANALVVFAHESQARSPALTLLTEGRSNYVRVLVYRKR
jgi:hypothetical protein